MTLERIMSIYAGSDGDATRALYGRLEACGPLGRIAVNVFRACKTSGRAKVYRGRHYRSRAYDVKSWSVGQLCEALSAAELAAMGSIGLTWGWGRDETATGFEHVLYVDLPTGQVSFHSPARGAGPDYPGEWDGVKDAAPGRVCRWCEMVLAGPARSEA